MQSVLVSMIISQNKWDRLKQPAIFFVYLLCLLLMISRLSFAQVTMVAPFNTITQVVTLPNGLHVILCEEHSSPMVAMEVVVRNLAATSMSQGGMAHFLEHIVFQGTLHNPGRMAPQWALEQLGGVCNATTTRDSIRFSVQVRSDQVATTIAILTDIVLHPLIRQDDCDKERAILLAEINQEYADPVAMCIEEAYARTYLSHPYHNAAKGSSDAIKRISADELRTFHTQWFNPTNISFIVVGDFDSKQTLPILQEAFSKTPQIPQSADTPILVEIQPQTPTFHHVNFESSDTYQVISYAVSSASNMHSLVGLELLQAILADTPEALLPVLWKSKHVNVKQFGIEYAGNHDPGRFFIWLRSTPADADKLYQITTQFLQQLALTPLPEQVVSIAKKHLAMNQCRENETYAQQAATLAFFETVGNYAMVLQYGPVLAAMTPARLLDIIPTTVINRITGGQVPRGE